MIDLDAVWREQAEYDRLLRTPPTTYAERTALTKELVLHLMSETDELLRHCGSWKQHRKEDVPENRATIRLDVADLFKLVVILAQTWDISPEEFVESFWAKSMIMRQRHTEEWVRTITAPVVVLDMDNVLADYVAGIVHYMMHIGVITPTQAERLIQTREWISYLTIDVSRDRWKQIKHDFRVSGGFSRLKPIAGAREFSLWCRAHDTTIVILTSRPIDAYPNIYHDTLSWLQLHGIEFDYIWWAVRKADLLLLKELGDRIAFAVDDDPRFTEEYDKAGIPNYLLIADREGHTSNEWTTVVTSFQEIIDHETIRQG